MGPLSITSYCVSAKYVWVRWFKGGFLNSFSECRHKRGAGEKKEKKKMKGAEGEVLLFEIINSSSEARRKDLHLDSKEN